MPIPETTIQIVSGFFIFIALALIVFTVAGGWRLPVKEREIKKAAPPKIVTVVYSGGRYHINGNSFLRLCKAISKARKMHGKNISVIVRKDYS